MAMEENEKIKDAVKCYNELTGDEEVKRLAEVRLMAQLEEQSALASARAKGEEKGLKQGKEEGLKQGKKEGLKQGKKEGLKQGKEEGLKQGKEEGLKQGERENKEKIAKKLLEMKMPIDQIMEITELSKKEIEKIIDKK